MVAQLVKVTSLLWHPKLHDRVTKGQPSRRKRQQTIKLSYTPTPKMYINIKSHYTTRLFYTRNFKNISYVPFLIYQFWTGHCILL
jgi:hypothetical protein